MNLRLRFSFYIVYFFTLSANSTHSFKFSIFSFWRQISMFFKTMTSMTVRFFEVYSRGAFTKSCSIFYSSNHSQMLWIPAIYYFTNVVHNFIGLKLFMKYHRKLVRTYLFTIVTNIAVPRAYFCPLPEPARVCNTGFFFKFIQIKNIISWRFKNTFHLSPSTVV